MLDISINLMLKKWKNNFLLAVIMGGAILLGILCLSTYEKLLEKTKDYDSFTKLYGGLYYIDYLYKDELMASLSVVPDEMHGVLELGISKDNKAFRIMAYDSVMQKYRIPLKEGVWYTDAEEGKYVNAVITPNDIFKVGDIIRPSDFDGMSDPELVIKICGITEDKFDFVDMCSYDGYEECIQSLYRNYTGQSQNEPIMIFTAQEYVEDYSYFVYSPFILLGYKNERDLQLVDDTAYTFAKYDSMESIRNNTERKVNRKMYDVLPVFVLVTVLTIICIASVVTIETMYELKEFSIFFLCGMKWRKVVGFNLIRAVVDFILSIGIMSAFGILLKGVFQRMQLIISIGVSQLWLCVMIFIAFSFAFCVAPAIIIRKKMPVDVIRTVNE